MELTELLERRFQTAETVDADIFAKAHAFDSADAARALGLYPYFLPLENNDGPVARLQGRQVIMLGSNNYLGLTADPRVREAAAQAARALGTSCTGSRLLNGTFCVHERLEERLAAFVGKEAALVFATGYQTNLGVLTALLGEHDTAVLDWHDHASLLDGARLARGRLVRFRHNDLADLERVLAEARQHGGGILVVVDGLYSMEGDLAPLPEIAPLVRAAGARLFVDDAHGLGTVGPGGRGTAAHYGLTDQVDLIMGTFSKSFASVGGFVAGPARVIDYIRHFGRPMLFSASLPPPNVAAVDAALTVLLEEPERLERLHANAAMWRAGLRAMGFEIGRAEGPIVPVIVGDEARTLWLWRSLLDAGVYTNCVLYPAVPRNRALLRTSVMATHEPAHLARALELFETVGRGLGIIG
ncbi:MAG: 2-amino-3-ketobutyrate CoA ligase [Planctomycetota bacterium]|nr:MAG: 2-amino-3-ketobutyrate CoA ligase [Planctomycetota bacterium]